MLPEGVKEYVKGLGYDDAIYLCKWNGFNCYEPNDLHGEVAYIGLPQVILEAEDGSVRLATSDEAMQFIDEAE